MFRIAFIFISFLLTSNLHGQEKCYKIDSIVVKYVPWELSSPIAFDEEYFSEKESSWLKIKKINELEVVSQFCEILLDDTLRMLKSDNKLDIRMIIEIYSSGLLLDKVILDKRRKYTYHFHKYLSSYRLNEWIDEWIVYPEE